MRSSVSFALNWTAGRCRHKAMGVLADVRAEEPKEKKAVSWAGRHARMAAAG
jgi:hypothetical protein